MDNVGELGRQEFILDLEQRYDNVLQGRKSCRLFRVLPDTPLDGVDFTHNDYLGLSRHPEVICAAQRAAETFGVGGQASRLLGGNATLTRELELLIAASKSENGVCLVFPSGFQLNSTVVATLLDSKLLGNPPQVFCDRLVHASLHAGIKRAGCRQHRFRHNDMGHFEELLKKKAEPGQPCFVFVESIYGMDGDRAPLQELYRLKQRYGFFLYVDEAHATGVAGRDGYGLAEQAEDKADLVMGTFSKGLGASGGYCVSSRIVHRFLVNFAPGFVYSTAPSPVMVAAVIAGWRLLPSLASERQSLNVRSTRLRHDLGQLGYDTGNSDTHIVPILIGEAEKALQLKQQLAEANVHVACIRPPTVPQGTARLRISLSTTHTLDQLKSLLDGLCK